MSAVSTNWHVAARCVCRKPNLALLHLKEDLKTHRRCSKICLFLHPASFADVTAGNWVDMQDSILASTRPQSAYEPQLPCMRAASRYDMNRNFPFSRLQYYFMGGGQAASRTRTGARITDMSVDGSTPSNASWQIRSWKRNVQRVFLPLS